jgi:hypothetical protein
MMSGENQNLVNLAVTLEQAKLLLEVIGYPLQGQCYHIAKKDKEFAVLKLIHGELQAEYFKKKGAFSYPYSTRMYEENDL